MTWSVTAEESGNYELQWRFANGENTNRSANILIADAMQASVEFESTANWSTWNNSSTITVYLEAGQNTIKLSSASAEGLPNIDTLSIIGEGVSPEECEVKPSTEPSPEPTPEPSEAPSPTPSPSPSEAPEEQGMVCADIPDIKALLKQYAPDDAALARRYGDYIDDLGEVECSTGGTGSTRSVSKVIVVPPNTEYDGRGERVELAAGALRCDGGQDEGQLPFFLLAPGASLKNVTIAPPGCEGVHMIGDNVLDNIVWEDVGEDAASVRSYFPCGDITILNSKGFDAEDKLFQFNAACDIRVDNFVGDRMGKFIKTMGETDRSFTVDVSNIWVDNVVSAVIQCESSKCYIRHHNLNYTFDGGAHRPDKVFRKIDASRVTEY